MSLFLGITRCWLLLYVGYKGARYNDVNEVMHMKTKRRVSGNWRMLLYEMHSITSGKLVVGPGSFPVGQQ